MLKDRYDLPLDTTSPAAGDAFVIGLDLLLAAWPGALARFDAALAADPGFGLARLGRIRTLAVVGDMPGARAALAEVEAAPPTDRRALSQLGILRDLLSGRAAAAFAGVQAHLAAWPRDALVASIIANQLGLIATSGRADREAELVAALGALAPHYGTDWWLDGHYGMALAEVGQHAEGARLVARSLAANPHNAGAAHAQAHVLYEQGEGEAARAFLRGWLPDYPADGIMHGHLSWHLALVELARGDVEAGWQLYAGSFGAEPYAPGPLIVKLLDAAAFLWRAELAGHSRDPARLSTLREFVRTSFPQPGMSYADWHAGLVEAAAGDNTALAARIAGIEALVAAGRYPAGDTTPAVLRGLGAFARRDWNAAIAALEPVLPELARIAGSRAQIDLVEFTLLKAYAEAGRDVALQQFLAWRRPGPSAGPVAGLAA